MPGGQNTVFIQYSMKTEAKCQSLGKVLGRSKKQPVGKRIFHRLLSELPDGRQICVDHLQLYIFK